MRLRFLGGADTVTGSRFLVQHGDSRVLVDCGMFQGVKRLRRRNWEPFPLPPGSIDAVAITHAHLDHTGWLPALVRDGFRGQIWCTELSAQLIPILLRDAAYLAEEEARHHSKHGTSRHADPRPLYTQDDAQVAIGRLRGVGWDTSVEVAPGVDVSFSRAGHILGAACVRVAGTEGSVVFTGDVGRPDDPVMLPPDPLPAADVVVTESTYGDRRHTGHDVAEELVAIVTRTVDRGGTLLVPSFAVGRAQALLHVLTLLRREGRIPDVPIHLNSPMATSVTRLLVDAVGEHRLDADTCAALWDGVRIHRSVEESKQLTAMDGPRIVITASGMLTGGRVLHHLLQCAPDPTSTILLPGFQAVGTRGRTLQDGSPTVRVFGRDLPVRAEVVTMDALSAHADADELLAWLSRTPAPSHAYVVHGEPGAADVFRRRLRDELGWPTSAPAYGDDVEIVRRG